MRHDYNITPKDLPAMGQTAGHYLVDDLSDLYSFSVSSFECHSN